VVDQGKERTSRSFGFHSRGFVTSTTVLPFSGPTAFSASSTPQKLGENKIISPKESRIRNGTRISSGPSFFGKCSQPVRMTRTKEDFMPLTLEQRMRYILPTMRCATKPGNSRTVVNIAEINAIKPMTAVELSACPILDLTYASGCTKTAYARLSSVWVVPQSPH
jgi:hypothetical protein